MKFEDAIEILLSHEGGYEPPKTNDPGGETNFGISKASYPDIDIKNLTRRDAIKIYRADFWDKYGVDSFPAKVRLIFFDCAVNQGPRTAIRLLQESCAAPIDGKLGPDTMKALSLSKPNDVLGRMSLKRHLAYTNNPHWGFFGAGWSYRLLHITLFSVMFSYDP